VSIFIVTDVVRSLDCDKVTIRTVINSHKIPFHTFSRCDDNLQTKIFFEEHVPFSTGKGHAEDMGCGKTR
jgi:hypothetical protein